MSKNATELVDYLQEECPEILRLESVAELLSALLEMEAIDARIEELKAERKAIKQQAATTIAGRLYSSVSNAGVNPLKFASVLYWLADMYLAATEILSPLGYSPNTSAKRVVYPLTVAYCQCGQPLTVNTRSDLQHFRTEQRRNNLRVYGLDQCKACRDTEQKRRNQRAEESAAAYAQRVAQLRQMPYREYLQTEEWKERRRRAMKRAGFRCQVCNQSDTLNVHHRTYERRGDERNDDLLVLCQPCHELFHRQGKLARE